MGDEKGNQIETVIDIETKSSGQPHNGKKIDEIIVSQYTEDNQYAVTYSKEDNSIQGWKVNVEESGRQIPDFDAYFKLDDGQCDIQLYKLYKLYKKMVLFIYYDDVCKYFFVCLKTKFLFSN